MEEPKIPDGMKHWKGGENAPDDWNGGSVYLDWGMGEFEIYSDEAKYLVWKHEANSGDKQANIIAYTPILNLSRLLANIPENLFWQVGHDGEGPDPSQFKARIFDPMAMMSPIEMIAMSPYEAIQLALNRYYNSAMVTL